MKTKIAIYSVVGLVLCVSVSMLVLVSGLKFIEAFASYYKTPSEMILAIGAVAFAAVYTSRKLPDKLVDWLFKDENLYN